MIDAIGIGDIGAIAVEVARARGQLDRRGRLVADEMDDVEALRELDQFDVILEVARAAAGDTVMDVRRTRDQAEGDEVLTEMDTPLRIARRQYETRRR
jgi:hypothetical protein